jgi:hypothetical protein
MTTMAQGPALQMVLVALVTAGSGCDLVVHPYTGSLIEMTLDGAKASAPGTHLELWVRSRFDDILRVDTFHDLTAGQASFGLYVRAAAPADDPCVIDDAGNLLTTAAAYPSTIQSGGVEQTPEEQATQVRQRVEALNNQPGGPLLAVVPYDGTPPPEIAPDAPAAVRKAACDAYVAASPLAYVSNPIQITAPLHGVVYGFVTFVSLTPPASYSGIRLDVPLDVAGVHELFLTVESDVVDPTARGPLYLVSSPHGSGRDTQQFDLVPPPMGSASATGTATLISGLDSDAVGF